MQIEITEPLIARFWAKVDKNGPTVRAELGPCWTWTASTHEGYGRIRTSRPRRLVPAHRVSWTLHNGPIPAGLLVLHRCDNPSCVNPTHLFVGTHADNEADKTDKGRRPRGERVGRGRLTDDAVRAIRSRYASGSVSQQMLAVEYGVYQSNISNVVSRKRWGHI